MWQMWTAFGIALGLVMGVALFDVGGSTNQSVCSEELGNLLTYSCLKGKNSWYIKKGNYKLAFDSLICLRHSEVQAARDLIYIDVLLEAEREILNRRNRPVEVITIPRNSHALQASLVIMIMQQFCGVGILAYGTGTSYKSIRRALLGRMGFGIINFLFALPAVRTIDTFGRRNLLLFTFPLMALCMAIATAVTWFFNWLLTITWPPIHDSMESAAFGVYAALNVVGFVLILLFVPETRNRTLEELDSVFEVPSKDQVITGLYAGLRPTATGDCDSDGSSSYSSRKESLTTAHVIGVVEVAGEGHNGWAWECDLLSDGDRTHFF
ncbi:hypothetical protein C7212DRAFT_365721 [Tuber magnatum]|uniref:Major facilitator superfamily (MFS) profile domain-containing protein n=1 Tax=Tuber magnatum TaxID=42249 RepID=A0A317SGQ9_9PEZI|nr:hypothetical protein C7212DRAFT_365721 [Tuber magnatum]